MPLTGGLADPETAVRATLAASGAAGGGGPLGIAVSGGGDSTALLLLLHRIADRPLAAVTVDHGLRPESAAEACAVAALCAARDIPHRTLRWEGRPGQGNLQDAAREARRILIARWARARGIAAVALGHTLDDQAETVLLRLARGSGVDGLAAMAPSVERDGILWLRPLLGLRREALRAWLRREGVGWCEDPSNEDPVFDRVRVRQALAHLVPLGVTPERLAATAAQMARARTALEAQADSLARDVIRRGAAGDLVLDPEPLLASPREAALRVVASALMWVSGARYRPRLARTEAALDGLRDGIGAGMTVAGCLIRPVREGVAIRREPGRAAPPVPVASGTWDGRWRLVARGAEEAGLTIGALGAEGLAALPRWRERAARAPRETLLTTPAIRGGDGSLVAAPLVDGGPWRFERIAAVPAPGRPPE